MRAWAPCLVAALLLAGCSDGGGGKDPQTQGPDFSEIDVEATATTGVIRGVVVDEGIRPIADVLVRLAGSVPRETTTTETGVFGFSDLEPGTYFIQAGKDGFVPTQATAEVVAGDNEPPAVKIVLMRDLALVPRAVLDQWNGFLQCGLSVIALCGAAGGVTQDNFNHVVDIEKPPILVQSEVIWRTTTSASDELWLWHSSATQSGGFNGTRNAYAWAQGPSPLVMVSNQTDSEASRFGTNNDLYLRMFTGSIDGTRNPTDPQGCYPGGPGPDIYCGGVGWSINQAFTVYTTIFYDFLPPEGWTFWETGEVPEPPQ